jgi:hypothetical protein
MLVTRRDFAQGLAAGIYLLSAKNAFCAEAAWTQEWDHAVLMNAVKQGDAKYDPKEDLLFHDIGPEYHYHTNLRDTRAHITRDSLDYAMNVLETGRRGRNFVSRISLPGSLTGEVFEEARRNRTSRTLFVYRQAGETGRRHNLPGADIPSMRLGQFVQKYSVTNRVAIDLGRAFLGLQFHRARFGKQEPRLVLTNDGSMLTLSLDLLNAPRPQNVSWAKTKEAFAAGTMMMAGMDHGLVEFDRRFAALACDCKEQDGNVDLTWKTPAGVVQVSGGTAIQTVDEQNARARFSIDGQPVPEVRLSNEKIAV